MRKAVMGMTALLLASLQSGNAETLTTARDYAVDSDVVLESAVKEVKSIPQDTVNVVGDAVKMGVDETVTAVNGVKAVFKADLVGKVENSVALEVASAWNSANDVVFRSYKVSSPVGDELTTGRDVAAGETVDVSGFFAGIDFPAGTSAMYRPEFKRLFVRQTLDNMLAIEDVIAEQHKAEREMTGKQVEVQTKFVEVTQSTLNELGFNWTFNGFDGDRSVGDGTVDIPAGQQLMSAGMRTAATAMGAGAASDTLEIVRTGTFDWSVLIRALEQSDDADVLSAPSITTRDGNTATIWVGEDRMIPKSFDAKSANTSVFIEHADWESELVGVQLEVTPELREGGLIDMELRPRVLDLIGYDAYSVTPPNATMARSIGAVQTDVPYLQGSLPYFRTRELETKLTVADGNTVAMGGLIYDKTETFKDKVPLLGSIPLVGRLFRSEGEKSIKRNLMIFVTATEVDINGRRTSDLAMKK